MFEKAARLKLRFSHRGVVTVEDLWDLPVEGLDTIYKGLNTQVKAAQEDSLLDTKSVETAVLELKVNIIKHIVAVKLAEAEARKNLAAKAVQKQKLYAVLEQKQDAELLDLPVDKIQEMIDELN
jgi:hypothetical protein